MANCRGRISEGKQAGVDGQTEPQTKEKMLLNFPIQFFEIFQSENWFKLLSGCFRIRCFRN